MKIEAAEYGQDGTLPLGMKLKVTIEGDLDEAQRKKLFEIAEQCPMKKIVKQGMKEGITTSMA